MRALGGQRSASRPALFVGFPATMGEPDFSRPGIIGFSPSGLPDADHPIPRMAGRETSRFPCPGFRAPVSVQGVSMGAWGLRPRKAGAGVGGGPFSVRPCHPQLLAALPALATVYGFQ